MRIRLVMSLAALLAAAGCASSDMVQVPTEGPSIPGRPQAANAVPNPYCAPLTSADIDADLAALFVKNAWPDVNSTKGKFQAVENLLDAGDIDGARAATKSLIGFLANKQSNLTPAERAASQALYDKTIADLWCFVGISGQVFDLNPGDPAKAFDVPGVGGVQFPANVVPVGTIVSLTSLVGGPCPLGTTLDCYPGYLAINLYPNTVLPTPATVVLCPPSTAPATLAIGHQDDALGFRILDPVPVPGLLATTCSTTASSSGPAGWFAQMLREATDLLLPTPLQASSVMFLGGIGGLTTRFSPFGLINTTLTAVGGTGGTATRFAPPAGPSLNPPLPPVYVEGNVGTTVTTNLPSVTVATPGGDANGSNPVAGVTVTFTTSAAQLYDPDSEATVCDAQGNVPASGSVQVVTNASGVATVPCLRFGTKAGFANLAATFDPTSLGFPNANLVTITATDANSGSSNSLNWLVKSTAGVPTRLGFATAPSTTGQAGVPLTQQPVLQLLDAFDNEVSVAGVTVTATVTTGGGTAAGNTATSDAAGRVTFTGLAVGGAVAGVSQTLSFEFSGATQPLTSSLLLSAGPAAQLAITTQPSATARAGEAFSTQPVVSIQDQYGNVVITSTASVSATVASGSPALAGSTSVTAVGGVATFSGLRIDGLVGTRTLSFSLGSISSAPTTAIVVASGAPAQLVITQQPGGTAAAGQPFSIQPIVTVLDQFGNPVTDPAIVTAILASGPPTLQGTTSISTVAGVAQFTDLRFDGVVGDRTLQFTSGSLTSPVTTGSVTVTAGSVAAIRTFMGATPTQTYSYGPGLIAFTNASPAPRVLVTDTFGNPVANQAVYWASSTSNGGLLTVGATGTPTNAAGIAQAESWLLGDGLNQATAGLYAPGVPPALPGYQDAVFTATTPTGVSVWACSAAPTSKADLGPVSIKAPNGTIKKVTVQMSVTGSSSEMSNYDATLVARLNGPTGTILGTATGKVVLPGNNGNPTAVTFSFPSSIAKQAGSATIWFMPTVVTPATRKPQLWHSSATFKANDPCFSSVIYRPGTSTVAARGLVINVTN
ncbi:MAG: hypothetical protein SFV24_08155 [Gemmatimonadales bacterium]|nr:hypothetical protein [Gemmatimonadales bacterium]